MPSFKKHMKVSAWSRGLMMGAAVLTLPACQTLSGLGPDPTIVEAKSTVPVEPDWIEPAPDALPNADWVASFQNQRLVELVNEALAENPTVGRSRAQLDVVLSRIRTSRSELYPTLGLSSSVSRSEGGTGFLAGQTSYDFGLNASWEADLFGRIRDQVSSAEAAAAASSADLAGVRVSVAGQVSQLWFNIIQSNLLVDLSERDIETQERAQRLTLRRFESGITGSSDVRLARSAVANAQALQATRLQNRDAQIRNLKILLRDYPDADLLVPEDLPELPALQGLSNPEYLLNRRPDILAAERRITEAGLNVDAARKNLYPSLSLSGGASEQALNLADTFDFAEIAFRLTAQLTAPIFQGGRIRGQIDGQEAQLRSQVETYVETVLQAYSEVENAIDAEQRLGEREAALRISVEEAQKAEDRLESRYIEGLATILQLLDAQSRRLSAEGQLINARTERLNNRVRMHVAMGGGLYGSEANFVQLAENEN
ncbi:efflux transporter outer membrane subunit [Litorimonas haliclonae]|uniref:efflux transporter outer membrane subunit n=1 Tax=Litorimonas haliclonae TaxID=2081977 RepID=UPI0039EE3A49